MAFNGFVAGILAALAGIALLAPWLNRIPWLGSLAGSRPRALATAVVLAALGYAAYRPHHAATLSPTDAARMIDKAPAAAAGMPSATGAAPGPSGVPGTAGTPGTPPASPMESAIASLEARLAKGGGKPDDWELLAKSFEFLGRPADAAKARAHQLPPVGEQGGAPLASASTTVSGEVTLDAALSARAKPGETLFIVAKSVDSPGAPVAVIRTKVDRWPVSFTLDDTQSMMPGRTLSTAGRVTVEARISHNGQPMPSAGDLQGSSGAIDPAAHKPLSIRIDRVIS